MKKIIFSVFGTPVGKQRPRLTNRGGFARAYTPKKTQDYEALVRKCYLETERYRDNYVGAVEINVKIENLPPASTPKSKKERLMQGEWKLTKPDIDNVLKSILDALNGIAFKDDSQVVSINCIKTYSNKDCVTVEIKYLD